MSKNISVTLSGVGADVTKDGRLKCNYIYITSNNETKVYSGEEDDSIDYTSYDYILNNLRDDNPIIIRYERNQNYRTEVNNGIYALSDSGNSYSFYRREYEVFYKTYYDNIKNEVVTDTEIYKGEWKPVAVNVTSSILRDFNIASDHSYQYILYPNYTAQKQQFALSENSDIDKSLSYQKGDIFRVNWNEWSLTELIPIENEVNAPIVKKTYKADINNIWLFKYNLETGSQTQNLSKNEISTLGQYPKIGYGIKNYISGDVSCLLGSEIIPYNKEAYIERLRGSINSPLSTNERVKMLNQWRSIAFSKNPKLLKDIKGQSWIVQIFSNSNTPHNFYKNQPDTISFSWKQIESTENCIIYGSGEELADVGLCASDWKRNI